MVTIADRTRKQLSFPNLGVSINVRLRNGKPACIDAQFPHELFHSEFDRSRWACLDSDRISADEVSNRKHDICNQLHVAGMALDILGRPSDADDQEILERVLAMAVESLTELEKLAD